MIAAPRSGSGKTTVTLGLLRAFRRRGVSVVGLKSGPDYIDPAFHAAASGVDGVNLDSWAMPPELLRRLAGEAVKTSALALCEASMGLFDGVPAPEGRSGASADVAAALGLPILAVIDVSGQAQSAAAVVKGLMTYDPRLTIAGVIINRVGSERHRRLAADAIEALGAPVVGALPREETIVLPERHLGLVQAHETEALETKLEALADFVERHIDCARVLDLAGGLSLDVRVDPLRRLRPPGQRIALARDAAFSFIYPHVLDGWRAAGAEVVAFSPLADEPPPDDCDACWLPGGYPELHAGKLAAARRYLGGLSRFRRDPARAWRMRGLHGARRHACRRFRRDARHGWTAFGSHQFRKAPHDARLSKGDTRRALAARAGGRARAGSRISLCDNCGSRERCAFRPCDGRLWRGSDAGRLAPRSRHRIVLSRHSEGLRRAAAPDVHSVAGALSFGGERCNASSMSSVPLTPMASKF